MRDDLTFADQLHRDLREIDWPEPAELRARARRRSRRTAAVAATAVLAVTSVVGLALGGPEGGTGVPPAASGPDASGSSAGGARPGRAEIPPEALLAPADLAVRNNVRLSDTGLGEPVQVDPLLEACAAARGLSAVTPLSRYSRSQTLLQDDTPGPDGPSGVPILTQDVYRLTAGDAAGVFATLDRTAAGCAGWRSFSPRSLGDDAALTPMSVALSWQVVSRDFAGDQAVLLRLIHSEEVDAETGRPVGWQFSSEPRVLVRVGDLVTVIVPATGLGAGGPSRDMNRKSDAELLDLGRAAARRMCLAANPSC
ncbi:hypothetical protein [Micromonospora sp. DT233]|uniref:hypothetical protein n=1 Tax=Micromonospora sp. DT233 TaxID=3393432 RepID=UPI003CF17F8F